MTEMSASLYDAMMVMVTMVMSEEITSEEDCDNVVE